MLHFHDHIDIIYQLIKSFLDKKKKKNAYFLRDMEP